MKVNAINVVEYVNNAVIGVKSFSVDPDGIKEAEECFKSLIKENGDEIIDDEIESYVEDGIFEQGTYQAFLTHSI